MSNMDLVGFGTWLLAIIGYGAAIFFALVSLTALASALFRSRRGKADFNRDMNAFAIAGTLAFMGALITAIALKLVA